MTSHFTANGTVTACCKLPDVAVTVTVYAATFVLAAFASDPACAPPPHATQIPPATSANTPSNNLRPRTPTSVTPNIGIHIAKAIPRQLREATNDWSADIV